MKIGVRLVSIITIFNIIGIGLLASFTLTSSQKEISRVVEDQAYSLAAQGCGEIKIWLGTYMDAVRTVANVMEGYKDIPIAERRMYFDTMLEQVLVANPELTSVYTNWAPEALDGMDAEYANTPGTDASGRYISGWTNGPDGPYVEAVTGFEWDSITQLGITTDYLFDPFTHEVGGRNMLIANLAVPVKDNSQLIGLVGTVIELSTIQSITDTIKPLGDGYAMIFSSGGMVTAHPNADYLGKNISEIDTFSSSLDTAVNVVSSGKTAAFSAPSSQGIMQFYAIPFTIGRNPKPWTLMVGVSRNTVMAPVYRMLTISLIIGAFTMILMSLGSIFIARSISRPIAYTRTVLKDIAEGDLTKELAVSSQDEVGDLARYLNFTVDKIKNLVLAIRNEADILSQIGANLASNMNETAASINEITANIQGIKTQTARQESSVKGVGAVMGQMVNHIDIINDQIQKLSECVSQSSAAIEQMLANIHSVTQTLIQNQGNVTKLARAADVGRSGLEEVSGNIQEIARESAGLLEINGVMENIASQTNLLSMNAAIEAAHAGDVGKGFAVVADEIRKLAESSSEQSKTISNVLKKIKASIDKITASTREVLENFEAISQGVKTVTDQEANVRSAMEEQETGSKAILDTIGSLNEITGKVKGSAAGMLGGSREVIEESKAMDRLTMEIVNGIQEMASGAEQIDTAVHQVNDISIENKQQIEQLIMEVSRFKVE